LYINLSNLDLGRDGKMYRLKKGENLSKRRFQSNNKDTIHHCYDILENKIKALGKQLTRIF
jgi:hypothetical protein